MCCKDLGADRVFAWPTAEIAVMGAEGCGRDRLPQGDQDRERQGGASRNELIEKYRYTFSTPYVAAGRRLVDDIIEPANTRKYLAQALESLHTKRDLRPPKKHGLIPL